MGENLVAQKYLHSEYVLLHYSWLIGKNLSYFTIFRLVTTEGQSVDTTDDIKNMESYVLVCMGDYKGFKKGNYGRSQPPPFHTSPRMSRKTYHGV